MTPFLLLPLACYFVAAVLYHVHLFSNRGNGEAATAARHAATGATLLGVVTHAMVLTEAAWVGGRAPLGRPSETLSLLAWLIAVAQLVIEARAGWAAIGSLSMPIAFIAVFCAMLPAAHGPHEASVLHSRLMEPHVLATILGFVSFALAFCCAVLYLIQSRLLKRKRIKGLFGRLPPLESISVSAHWMATAGFSMLTLGIVTGVIWAMRAWRPGWYLDPKVVTSFFAWLVYAAYLYASAVSGWRGRKTTYFLIAGFIVVLIAYYGVNLVAPGQHRF
jgi:ABC-type transport system involved in cytochrome c biogenesis permease subunit